MKRTALIVLLVAAGCVHRLSSDLEAWVGKSEADLVSKWGAPDLTAPLSDSSKVLTWITKMQDQDGEKHECRRSFTISPAHTVTKWSYRDCPKVYLGR